MGIILISLVLIFTGCIDEPNGNSIEPVINGITYGFNEVPVTEDGLVEIGYRKEVLFSANAENATIFSWTADVPGRVTITPNNSTTAMIKGIAGGDVRITFTASDGTSSAVFEFTIQVEHRPAEGLWLDVIHENDFVTENQEFIINEKDSEGLTFIADAAEDNADVSDAVTWTAEPSGIVTLSVTSGSTVIITPREAGEVIITVKITSVIFDDEELSFKIIVEEESFENVLFLWRASDYTGSIPNITSGGSAPSFTHTNFEKFMEQKDGMVIKSMRGFGSTVTTNAKGLALGSDSSNARLAIGQYANEGTAAGSGGNPPAHSPQMDPIPDYGGEIDLYRKKVRLTIEYADASTIAGGYLLRIYIGNNGTGEANSIFGAASNLVSYGTDPHFGATGTWLEILDASEGNTLSAGKIIFEIDTTTETFTSLANERYLAKTFIALHCQSGGTNNYDGKITITSIKLEYIDGEETPDVLALEVKEEGTVVPSAGITIIGPEEKNISANVTPVADSITWVITNTDIATVHPASGQNVTIAAGTETGTTSITVTAIKDGYFSAARTFNITVQNVPIELSVKQEDDPVGASIQMKEGDPSITLSAEANPSTTINWESDKPEFVTVTPLNGGTSATITAEAPGTATITVSAELAGYESAQKIFTVAVIPADGDPNLIWEWNYGTNNGAKGTFTSASDNAYLVGKGVHPKATVMPIRLQSGAIENDDTKGGIRINASSTTGILSIGTSSNTGSLTDSSPAGEFNFKDLIKDSGKIKITIACEFETAGQGNRAFIVQLNNNTSGGTNSPFGQAPSRIFYWQNTPGGAAAPSNWNSAEGLAECVQIDKSLTDTNNYLDKVFIGIVALGLNAGNAGCTVLIKGIKIEYVPEVPSDVIFEWDYNEDGWTNLAANANGSHDSKNIRAGGQDLNSHATEDGVILNEGGRFIIGGSTTSVPTTSTTVTDTGGQFNFSSAITAGRTIKISIDYKVLNNTGSQSNKFLRIQVNNNTTTNNASVLNNWEVARGQIDSGSFPQEGTLSGIFNPGSATLTTAALELPTPLDLQTVLSQSLIAITLPGNSGSVLIKSVKIEYTD